MCKAKTYNELFLLCKDFSVFLQLQKQLGFYISEVIVSFLLSRHLQKWIFCVKLSRSSMKDFHWILNLKFMNGRHCVQLPKRNGKRLTSERMLIQMIIQRPIHMQDHQIVQVVRIRKWNEWLSTYKL